LIIKENYSSGSGEKMLGEAERQPGKYALGLHTTSAELGLGLTNFQDQARYQFWPLGRDLSTQLHPLLAEFLLPQNWLDLSFIAVACGPGSSFTGTRIGLVTARTLAQQLQIPLFPVSSLEALAWAYFEVLEDHAEPSCQIAVEIPAQRGEVFAAIYEQQAAGGGLSPVLADTLLKDDDWEHHRQKISVLPTVKPGATPVLNTDKLVRAILDLAYQRWQQGERPHWSQALPFYGVRT